MMVGQAQPAEALATNGETEVRVSDIGIAQNIARFGSFRSRAASHAGTAGRHNEDAYLNRPDLGLWAVADGAAAISRAKSHRPKSSICCKVSRLAVCHDMLQEVRSRLETAHERLRARRCAVRRRDHGDHRRGGPGARRLFCLLWAGILRPTCCAAIH